MNARRFSHWRRARITIDANALAHNLKCVREFVSGAKVMAVIKADAYGHGMSFAAEAFSDADMFAVAMPEEAYALRSDGVEKPIIVLQGFINSSELQRFSDLGISTVVHQRSQLDALMAASLTSPIDAWLKVDTGMNRLGIKLAEVDDYFGLLRNCGNVSKVYLMSHFSNADDINKATNNNELESFIKVTNDIDVDCSMANSAAVIGMPASHFEVVRPGIMLYGSSPIAERTAVQLGLHAAMQFESVLMDIRLLKAGDSIGYGSTFTAEKDMRIGIVAAGYADGYPRHAKNGTPVWINDQRCNLVGRVSMDSICIDLADTPAALDDRVVLWGNELSVDEVAHNSDSISYELLCNAGAASFVGS